MYYNFALFRYFEQSSGRALANKDIAVWQTLRPGYVGAEELDVWFGRKFPDDLVVLRIYLDDPGARHAVSVHPIVKDLDVAVFQPRCVVLVGDLWLTVRPCEFARRSVDDADPAVVSAREQEISIGVHVYGIYV